MWKALKFSALTIALLACIGCPDNDSDNTPKFQASQSIQDGLQLFKAYAVYFDEYKQAQATSSNCNPFDPNCNSPCPPSLSPPSVNTIACQILNPTPQPAALPNPVDPIPLATAPLVFPGSGQAVLPNQLSTLLQNDFQVLLKRIPAS
jgi:hypothetical protein